MNHIEQMTRMAKVREMLEYMASEIVSNMKRIVLSASGEEDKYAIKWEVDSSLKVWFSIYNTETRATVNKYYDTYDFTRICSNVFLLETTFNDLTFNMLEAVEKQNTVEAIYL